MSLRARDPKTGILVHPARTGQRAECPFCKRPMASKCGEVNVWHWSHLGETCETWTARSGGGGGGGRILPPRGLCFTCRKWSRGCNDARSEVWRAAYSRPTEAGVARVFRAAPACPGHQRRKTSRREVGAVRIRPSQVLDPAPAPDTDK